MTEFEINYEQLDTGDIAFIKEYSFSDKIYNYFLYYLGYEPKFTHIGIILKNPIFLKPGTYIVHFSKENYVDHRGLHLNKYGIRIDKIENYIKNKKLEIFIKRFKFPRTTYFETEIFNHLYDLKIVEIKSNIDFISLLLSKLNMIQNKTIPDKLNIEDLYYFNSRVHFKYFSEPIKKLSP